MSGEGSESNALRDITFGSAAGMASKVFEHPFDLVKVRLQSQPTDRPLTFTGPLDCFKQTYAREGAKGLYRGLSAPVVGAMCENATLFLVYNKCQDLIVHYNPLGTVVDQAGLSAKARGKRRELRPAELALAAAGAGAVASFVLTPIELIKCKMQVQMLAREGAFGGASVPHPPPTSTLPAGATQRSFSTSAPSLQLKAPPAGLPPPEGPFALIASTVRNHGLRGLWLGQMGTLFRETGGSAAWFTTYELVSKAFVTRRQRTADALVPAGGEKRTLSKLDLAAWESMTAGACAGMAYNIILFPADSIKSAMQTWSELHPGKDRMGFWAMGRRIWRDRGIRGMYAGCGVTVARAAPSSAMIFGIYATLEKKFGSYFD